MTLDVTSSENPSPTSPLLSSALSLFAREKESGRVRLWAGVYISHQSPFPAPELERPGNLYFYKAAQVILLINQVWKPLD